MSEKALLMSESMIINFQKSIERNPKYRFWFWQLGFWFFMCVVGFFTLILWYAEASVVTIGHVLMQAIIGLLCSLFLHFVFVRLDNFRLGKRALIGLTMVLAIAFIWTMIHMKIYVTLTGFEDVWEEFGGWYFSGIFIFLCWTGLFHGVRYYELMQQEHKIMLQAEATSRQEHFKRLEAQSEARDAKLKMLRYQLNPHFLCNTLNAINSLIELQESQKAQEMTVQLSEFLRYSLDNDPDTKILLKEEIDALSLYLEIEKTRFGDRLKVDMEISKEAQSALVPSLLLQPIIENSMKHAIAKSEAGGSIEIYASIANEQLRLTIKDSGSGKHHLQSRENTLPVNVTETKQGVGLKNINQRLKALYHNDYQINSQFESAGGLTTEIRIPAEFA